MSVRELPPLRLHWNATTPNGKNYRWGEDEPNPANIPSGVSFSTTMPGGFEQAGVSLPRKSGVDYSDLERLSTLTAYGPGGEVAWEGRLERAPRVSGEQMAVSPGAVGWQAHLEDDKSAVQIYHHMDLSAWRGPSPQRRINIHSNTRTAHDPTVSADQTTGLPSLNMTLPGPWATGAECDAYLDAGGARIASYYWARSTHSDAGAGQPSANFVLLLGTADDDILTGSDLLTDQHTSNAEADTGTFTATTPQRFAAIIWRFEAVNTAASEYTCAFSALNVVGDHGLTLRGTQPNTGFYGSDVVGHAVQKFAPLLSTEVQQSSFIIPHLAFLEPTTAGEIVRQATRVGLQDWAVWENKLFVWHNRGERGRSWRARISPSQLEEAGASVERLYESVVVQYQDVDGSTRTVGPPGSGANTEDSVLKDDDTENPANKLGITKRALLQVGTYTPASATELGRRFLEEQKLLDSSGRAVLVGHVEDSHGVKHPAWKVRAGDTITFVDASDTSARRIVRTSYDHGTRTCSIDIDAPPEGLQALLERQGAVLVDLGL